ncbi:MAG: CDP-alcohol phosphatidyltransferase family protein [Candidatus Omnitrophota bacterium]|jgi:cardiolipin synthase
MNWANRITIVRIILVPVFITAVLYHRLYLALGVFALAAVTDALDGYLARVRKERTQLGRILDPVADKMLLVSAFISLSLVSGLPDYLKMPAYVPIIVISRDAIILLGAVVIYLLTQKMEIRPTVLGKVTTFFQMMTIISLLLGFVYSNWIWNTTVVLTVLSGLDYIRIGAKQVNEKH